MKRDPVFWSKLVNSLLFVAIFTVGYWDKLTLALLFSVATLWPFWRSSTNGFSTLTWPTVWFMGILGFGIGLSAFSFDLLDFKNLMLILTSLIGPAAGLHLYCIERAGRLNTDSSISVESSLQ